MAISDIATRDKRDNQPGPSCSVCAVLASLPESEAGALIRLLADPAWRYQTLSDELATEGIDLNAERLSRHARGRCLARTKLR